MNVRSPQVQETDVKDAYLILNNQIIPIESTVINIGRQLENDIVIQDNLVSREHAQIRFDAGHFSIHDIQSTGGTFVNKKRITRCILNSGDVISLAGAKLMFVDNSSRLKDKTKATTRSLGNGG